MSTVSLFTDRLVKRELTLTTEEACRLLRAVQGQIFDVPHHGPQSPSAHIACACQALSPPANDEEDAA